jgi:tetratricopeptide (TPR) repeat protein
MDSGSDADIPIQPLSGNPKREAADSGRGLIYQYWQTIWRWVWLKPDEVLFIEKAEDFDVIAGTIAETAQIKDTAGSGTVTLNSKDVLESIANFLEIKEKNKEFRIDFRFLTTAERGHEKSNEFGNQKGLDYWDDCRFDESKLKLLRAFLLQKTSFPNALKHFLKNSSDEEFRVDLVERISWETGSRSIAKLKALIVEQVCCFAETRGVPRALAVKVVAHLFQHVCDLVAESKERRLHRDDFLRIFDEEIQSRPEFAMFQSGIAQSNNAASFDTNIKSVPPRLFPGISKRSEVISKLLPVLKVKRALALKGSTGMGKSTLANCLVRASGLECRWMDLRGLKVDEIRLLLHRQTFSIPVMSGVIYVLDDLPLTQNLSGYENALVDFCYTVRSQGGILITTAQSDLPAPLLSQIELTRDIEFAVPPLGKAEIAEITNDFGCQDAARRKAWTLLIYAKTHGHPQLVLAMAKNLQSAAWPKPSPSSYNLPDLGEVRKNARRLLRESLPSETARTLAFRLSLIDKPFRRDHAIYIAGHPPPIQLAGEAFEILVGPWIEQIDDSYFRISPLLEGAATDVWSDKEVIDLQRTIAEGFLSCGKATLLETAIMLQHGLAAGAVEPVMAAGQALVEIRGHDLSKAVLYFVWLVPMRLGKGEVLFPSNVVISGLLRETQFALAQQVDPERSALAVARKWEEETVLIGIPEMNSVMRMGFLIATIAALKVPFSFDTLLARAVEVIPLIQNSEAKQFFVNKLLPNGETISLTDGLFSFILVRVNAAQDVLDLFASLEKLQENARQPFLDIIEQQEQWSSLICGKIYLTEEAQKQPNWAFCITSLKFVASISSAWKMPFLTACCYGSIAVIYDEYLNDSSSAFKVLDEGRRVLGEHPILGNQHGMVLYRQNRYADALAIFERILPNWDSKSVTAAFAAHKAEVCAGQLGDWQKANQFALLGKQKASEQGLTIMALGFQADHAWALWKIGKREESIKAFAGVLQSLPPTPNAETNFRAYALHRQVGHAIGYLLRFVKPSSDLPDLAEPPSGWFSTADVSDRIKKEPLHPLDFAWLLLAHVESEITPNDTVLRELEARAFASNIASVRFASVQFRLRWGLRSGNFSALVKNYISCMEHFKLAVNNVAKESLVPLSQSEIHRISQFTVNNPDHVHLGDLLFAAVVLGASKTGALPNLSVWRADLDSHVEWRTSQGIHDWLDFASSTPSTNFGELQNKIAGRNYLWTIGSFFLSSRTELRVEDRLLANMILIDAAAHSNWRGDIEICVENLIGKSWERILLNERFTLQSPMATGPLLASALRSQNVGLKKAAEVALAVTHGERIFAPDNLLREIRLVAGIC